MVSVAVIVVQVVVLVFSVVFHEVAHRYAAWRLGDPTARMSNRLSLHPLRHIDPVGSVILPILLVLMQSSVLFGWAKPVPFNPYFFRNARTGTMIVAAAGPLSNFLLAGVALGVHAAVPVGGWVAVVLATLCMTNVVLGVFNLIPIPPLDGSRIVFGWLNDRWQQWYMSMERYGMVIVLVLVYGGLLDHVIMPLTDGLQKVFFHGL